MSQRKIRKAVISGYGDVSNINVVEAELAPPADGEVQVRVLYCGFSGADVNMRLGTYPLQQKPPLTPGYSIVGSVVTKGSTFQPEDLVACLTKYGGNAELINLPEKHLVPVDKHADLQATTALVLDWATAYAMTHHTAKVRSGQRVFIHGMSGAVGYALTVLAKLQGAEVHGTASMRNHEQLRELGAIPHLYTNKDWVDEMKKSGGVDAVFDALGPASWDDSYDILNASGILVGYGTNSAALNGGGSSSVLFGFVKFYLRKAMSLWRGKTTAFYLINRENPEYAEDLKALLRMQQAGEIDVVVKKVFDLEDIQEAHSAFGKLPGIGSVLIKVGKEVDA
jgi:NADPH:quinone reductase-like Zn-dependent oxidoreductase